MRVLKRKPREWKMVVDNLEQMHPRYLASLLANGDLEKVVDQRVRQYNLTLRELHESNPTMPFEQAEEIAQAESLIPVNQHWQDEKPLTRDEQAKLKAFLVKM